MYPSPVSALVPARPPTARSEGSVRITLIALVAILAVTVAACGSEAAVQPQDDLPERRLEIVAGDGRAVEVSARIAHRPSHREHGLMGEPDLPPGAGMLFVYPDARPRSFWMKDTLIPLDIAYADADRRVFQITRMEPCAAEPCPGYPSEAPAQYALEVPAGWFEEVGVAVGWRLTWEGEMPPAQ
jgi:uncharacterized protein